MSEPAEPETTGLAAVDDVLASLHRLDELPVEEHVAVFESAHEGLRAALADGAATADLARGPHA